MHHFQKGSALNELRVVFAKSKVCRSAQLEASITLNLVLVSVGGASHVPEGTDPNHGLGCAALSWLFSVAPGKCLQATNSSCLILSFNRAG
jgi:hypothetical protein